MKNRSAYSQGIACGTAKRAMAGRDGHATHEQLDAMEDQYRGLSSRDRSPYFKDFYRGIADALRCGEVGGCCGGNEP
jgi:hypothetical protein